MNSIIKIFLLGLLLHSTVTYSQIPPAGLQIGDTIPASLLKLPLEVVSHPNGRESVTLGDYEGKVIVLDFWTTWCKPCLVNIPDLFELQEKFGDDMVSLLATKQKKEVVDKFLTTTKSPRLSPIKNQLFSIVEANALIDYFPYQTVPHTVIIDKSRVVRALTLPEYLTENLLQELISSPADFSMPTKVEGRLSNLMLEPTYEGTLPPLYYSAVLGFTPGSDGYTLLERDTINGIVRFYAKSQPIVALYRNSAHPRDFGFMSGRNRRILIVRDPSRYSDHFKEDGSRTIFDPEWKKANCYSYEAVLPLSFTTEMFQKRMKNDLDSFFGLNGSIEKRTVACLVLRRIPGKEVVLASMDSPPSSEDVFVYRARRMTNFVLMLNNYRGRPFPPVFDETGYDEGIVTLELPKELGDVSELQQKLREQGLDLVWEDRELGMFVLREDGYHPKSSKMELTQYGYIPAELVSELPPSPSYIPKSYTPPSDEI